MRCEYACGTTEHTVSRRSFLGGLAAGSMAAGLGSFCTGTPAVAEQLQSRQKRVLNIFLHGGVSQLETWDPKPNTDTGGPFRPISTSAPGVQICELLPYTAQQMHRLAIVRSLNTRHGDHGRGQVEMTTGRNRMIGAEYPHLGAVTAKALTPDSFPLPGHILIPAGGSGSSSVRILGQNMPASCSPTAKRRATASVCPRFRAKPMFAATSSAWRRTTALPAAAARLIPTLTPSRTSRRCSLWLAATCST